MDKTPHEFMYFQEKLPRISKAKIKEEIFVGLQIRELIVDEHLIDMLSDVENILWLSFTSF
jgi:hypothetical protein